MSKNLVDLNIDEVASWLKSISLDNAFAGTFKEQQIDGSMLKDCEEDDFEPSDFPKARKMHWKKFWYYCNGLSKMHATANQDVLPPDDKHTIQSLSPMPLTGNA